METSKGTGSKIYQSPPPIPSKLKDGDKEITDPVDIANGFNGFFTNIVKEYFPAIDESTYPPIHEKLKAFVDSKVSPKVKFGIPHPIQQYFVQKELLPLDPKSSRNRWGIIKDTKRGCSINCISCYKNYQS